MKTVKFNVGGPYFEMSCALIEQQPESMLAQMVLLYQKGDGEKHVFINKICDTFHVVLDYLHSDSVVLSPVIPTEIFLHNSEFHGLNTIWATLQTATL